MIVGAKKHTEEVKTATAVLKKLGSSPIFLAGVIAYTLTVLVSLVMSVSNSSYAMGVLYELADALDMEAVFLRNVDFVYAISGVGSVISGVIGSIPLVVITVGLWMCFAYARKRQSMMYNTSGLTIIKVISIVQLVFLGIGILFSEVILLVITIVMASSFSGAAVVPVMMLSMVILIAVFALEVYYYIKVIKTINVISRTAATGVPNEKVSRFVGGYLLASAVISVIALVVALDEVAIGYGYALAMVLECVCTAVSSVCLGTLIFKYRKEMKAIME